MKIARKETKQLKTKIIFSPQLAQHLLNNDFVIVDIKPKRGFPNETVFVFRVDGGFDACVEEWLNTK